MKQAIIIRTDLKMGKGKMIAQACHASLNSFFDSDKKTIEKWISEGMKKIVLKVSSEKDLRRLYELAKRERLPSELINDAGLTQLEPGTVTALGIGPAPDEKIDKITGNLKLL
jgi:PTH2 family peptidyl-tRNA hydrolase